MRLRLITFNLIIGFITITGCNINDDNDNDNIIADPMNGEWNLRHASSGWVNQSNLEVGTVKFNFDTENSILNVNNTDESLLFVPTSGNYPYSIVEYENENYIIFEDDNWNFEYNAVTYGYMITLYEYENESILLIDHGRFNTDQVGVTDSPSWQLKR